MPVVPSVAVEHEHGRSRGRELRSLVMSTPGLDVFYWRTTSSDGNSPSDSTGVSPMFSTVRCSSRNALILTSSGVVSSRSVYGMEKSVGTGTSGLGCSETEWR
jgi:hypothetical protein